MIPALGVEVAASGMCDTNVPPSVFMLMTVQFLLLNSTLSSELQSQILNRLLDISFGIAHWHLRLLSTGLFSHGPNLVKKKIIIIIHPGSKLEA